MSTTATNFRRLFVLALIGTALVWSCQSTPSAPQSLAVRCWWITPGNDGYMNIMYKYDGRFSLVRDSLVNFWDSCAVWPGIDTVTPKLPLQKDSLDFIFMGQSNHWYYFALKAIDQAGNVSLMSNIDSIFWPDTIPPAPPESLTVRRL